jgi:hypothetical protein
MEGEFKPLLMEGEFLDTFRVKDGLSTSAGVEKAGVGFKMLAFNNSPIPMTVEGFERKNITVVMTVINTVQEGFSKVPYENVNGKTKVSSDAKPLNTKFKMGGDVDLSKMKCWPFGIVEGCPKDKDERVDDWSWDVVPGMALRVTIWQEAARGGKADKFKSSMNSDDYVVIPAFTVFEIEMTCKVHILNNLWKSIDFASEIKNCNFSWFYAAILR